MALSTEGDRTIFFDFLPMSLGKIRGIETDYARKEIPNKLLEQPQRYLETVAGALKTAATPAAAPATNSVR